MSGKRPEKDLCGCNAFCIEDTARSGRVCRLDHSRESYRVSVDRLSSKPAKSDPSP